MKHMASDRTRTAGTARFGGAWYEAADLACAGLGVGLAVSSVRLFANNTAIALLISVALGAWALASVLRRAPLPTWLANILHLLIGTALLLVIAAPAQRWGFLPTPASVQHIVEAIRSDFSTVSTDIAPLVAGSGHLVVMCSLLWILALFNSTAAMRFRAPVQGVVPHLCAFVGLGLVARDSGRITAAVALCVTVGLYALTQAAWRNAAVHWVPPGSAVTRRSFAIGATVVMIAGVITAVAAPIMPGSSEPVLDLRRGGTGDDDPGGDRPRTVISPFVDVGAQLGPRRNELLFTMTAPNAQYWRITALDSYDAQEAIWVLSNSYEPADPPLSPDATAEGRARLDVRGLGGIWVPAPQRPVTAEAPFRLNWDPLARSLIRSEGDLVDGDEVAFTTADPGYRWSRAAERLSARGTPSTGQTDEILSNPEGVTPELADLASRLAVGRTPHEGLVALQDHFRESFTYDEAVDFSDEPDPLAAFMALRRGFCQQFATAFAMGARSLGYPTRVVVGFTMGDPVGRTEDGSTVYAVHGRHAHAWPEVHFDGIGWVPYEPTPGRGNPATTAVTGVAPAQVEPPKGETPPPDLPGTTAAPAAAPPVSQVTTTTAPAPGEAETPPGSEDPSGAGSNSSTSPGTALAAALLLAVILGAAAMWARRRRTGGADPDPVARAWLAATETLAGSGRMMSTSDTPLEFARRCDADLRVPELIGLAELETSRRWAKERPEGAGSTAAELLDSLDARLSTRGERTAEAIIGP